MVNTILRLVQVAILARQLSPADYGLMAMVGVVLGFAALFSDFGVNSAFVQRSDVTQEQRSSLFWFNVVVSGCLTLVVVAASPLIARFFGDDRLTQLIMLSALTFVTGALGAQAMAGAQKELNFRSVAVVEIVVSCCSLTIAVAAAMAGWGVYALVTAGLASSVVTTMLAWIVLSRGWRPQTRMHITEVRPFLGFGSAFVANNLVNQFNASMDLFLAGRWLTAAQLGLYSVPRNLVLQVQSAVNPIITRVGFPLLAAVQDDIPRVRSIYLKTLNMTASTNAPVYLAVAWFSSDIVSVLLGPNWERSADLLRILALWGAIRATGNPVGSLLLGMGRADLSLKWNLALLLVYPPLVWAGSMRGPDGVAWAMLAFQLVAFVPGWYFLVRPLCRAGLGEYAIAALRPFFLAFIAVLTGYWVASFADVPLLRLVLGGIVGIPAYFAVSYLANREWTESLRELAGMGRRV